MQPQHGPAVRTGIVVEPGAAHLDHYLEAIAACEGIGPCAYADATATTTEAAAKRLPNPVLHESAARLLKEFRPEFCIVLMEARHAAPWVIRALNAGCHVFTDKHPVACAADLAPVFDAARRSRRYLTLSFPNRCHRVAVKAREILRTGRMGRLYGAHLLIASDQSRLRDPAYLRSWRASRAAAGGGILMAIGIHHLDLLLYLAGERIVRVAAFCANAGGSPVDIEDSCAATFELAGGGTATLQAGFYLEAGWQSRLELWHEGGRLRLDLGAAPSLVWGYFGEANENSWSPSAPGDPTRDFLQLALDSVRRGTGPVMTADHGHHVLRCVFAAYESAETGASVALPSMLTQGV